MRNFFISFLFMSTFFSCQTNNKVEIIVLHAGSLSVPFKQIAMEFMRKFPNVSVLSEAHGSRTAARQISDLHRRADVLASADSDVISNLLIPEYADFCIDFANNEMVIMYSDSSKYSQEIDSKNWYEILLRKDVAYGHSDPDSDPCGYRTLLSWQLAEKYYEQSHLAYELQKKMSKKNIRSKETDLIALLQTGELDYVFIYRSIAEQHKMPYLKFPDEINLKSASFSNFYRTATIKISGRKPGEWIEKRGAPMVYGLTLPKNARNSEWGAKYITFILGKEGQRIMKKNGQPEIIPPGINNYDKLPQILKDFLKRNRDNSK